jgi:hypothetical protein
MTENKGFLNLDKIIGFFHFLISIFNAVYGFIFKKNRFDYVYIIYSIIVFLSWTFFNGECIITYIIKKHNDKNYKIGDNSTDLKNMYLLVGSKNNIYIIISLLILFNVISLFIVLKRNNFPKIIYISYPIIKLLYTFLLRICLNISENTLFQTIQYIIRIILIIFLYYVLYFLTRHEHSS